MSDAPRRLPANPSLEHLKKDAKRLARAEGLKLADAQRRLAYAYGHRNWAELAAGVRAARARAPLYLAAQACDAAEVARLLAAGADPDGSPEDPSTPLYAVCAAQGPDDARLAIVEALIDAGSFLHTDRNGETPLHAAARTGPLALVELMLSKEVMEWPTDSKGRMAWQVAADPAIAHLLHRPVIDDPVFRDAVAAIHAGDALTLAALLDAHPRLLTDRIVEPVCYRRARRQQYFRDPKLFWFVADNPDLVVPMPPGMVDCARAMIARGVAKADLDYTLELAMTSGPAQQAGLVVPLMEVLIDGGATPGDNAVVVTLAHLLTAPIEALLARGAPVTVLIAAGLGRLDDLARTLPTATPEQLQAAFGLAVINRRHAAARMCLAAGADVNGYLPIHAHSTALHQAANHDDVPMLELLVAHGARRDLRDKLWRGTALGWAIHEDRPAARAYLEGLEA